LLAAAAAEEVVEVEDAVAVEVLRVREAGSLPPEARHVRLDPVRVLDRAPQRLPPDPQVRQPPRKADLGQQAVRPLRALEQGSGQRKLAEQRRRIGLLAQDHRRGKSIISSMFPVVLRLARSVQRAPHEQAAQPQIFCKEEAHSWLQEQLSAVRP
jgi:hypothetical protein